MNPTVIVNLIEAALPMIGGASPAITAAIKAVVELTPVAIAEYQDLKPRVLAIIAALKSDPAANAAQIAELEQQEVQWDADFDQAAADALAADAAAKKSGS